VVVAVAVVVVVVVVVVLRVRDRRLLSIEAVAWAVATEPSGQKGERSASMNVGLWYST